jgi:hypothetical protein
MTLLIIELNTYVNYLSIRFIFEYVMLQNNILQCHFSKWYLILTDSSTKFIYKITIKFVIFVCLQIKRE